MNELVVDRLCFRERGPYSFRIGPDECLGLHGSSGAGKSLLLRAIADLDPHGGTVRLGGLACEQLPAPEWRKRVALLPAESFWWHDTVGEHFRNFSAMPEHWITLLGFDLSVASWRVNRLSTGEKQRLAVLRLLENQPLALLLDEPTASLDIANTRAVEKVLLEYARREKTPVCWVSHDPAQLARVATRRMFMNDAGELQELADDRQTADSN